MKLPPSPSSIFPDRQIDNYYPVAKHDKATRWWKAFSTMPLYRRRGQGSNIATTRGLTDFTPPHRHGSMAMVVFTFGVVLAACGSGPTTSPKTTTASGAQNSSQPSGSSGLSLARLDSLTNYTFTSISSNGGASITISGNVHNPTDWENHASSPSVTTYDVNGSGYSEAVGQVIRTSFNTPEGVNHLMGEQVFAEQLIGYTHVTGIRITTAASCTVAGMSGKTYNVQSPSTDTSILNETATACVSDSSGALLSYTSGIIGGSAARTVHVSGANNRFTVTSIGGVGRIVAPKAPATTTIPTVPSNINTSPGLPTGFPGQVPSPPGTIFTSTQVNPTKWYIQLTEKNSSALTQYAGQLQSKGFTITSSTNNAAGSIDVLSRGPLQVMIEQMSLPGQGIMLTVTVTG